MKSNILSVLIVFFLFSSYAHGITINYGTPDTIKGSGKIAKESRAVDGFESIRLTGTGDIYITENGRESLTIEADDNLMKHIRTRTKGNSLIIDYQPEALNMQPTKVIKFFVTMNNFTSLNVSGVCNLDMSKFRKENLKLNVEVNGVIEIKSLRSKTLFASVKGSGNITAHGEVSSQTIMLNGTGNYDAYGLKSRDTKIELQGTGNAAVWATEQLDATIKGVGNIEYYGNPVKVNRKIEGVGLINSMGGKR